MFKSAILFSILNPTYEMCFKPIKPTVPQPNSNDVLKKFNQLSLRAAQHNKQHKQHT